MIEITKDVLQEIIQNTHGLGVIELVKITGTQTETEVSGVAEDRSLILNGKFNNPVLAFNGLFGMPNLGKLKTILGFTDEYDENAEITVQTQQHDGVDQPAAIRFENATGDFVNEYRLMSKAIADEKVKSVVFKGATWNIDFEPMIDSIRRLKKQASVHSEETTFSTTITNSNLIATFGNPGTHSGNFVLHPGITGKLTRNISWPVKQFLSIMDLTGDKRVHISDQGVMRITVNSGIAQWEFLLPAQSK